MQYRKENLSQEPLNISKVLKNFKESITGKPHDIEEIRQTLEEGNINELNLISALERHHDYLLESIEILIDQEADASEKQNHLGRFISLLDMHTKAEEETLYKSLRSSENQRARLDGLAGQDEHDLAAQLVEGLQELSFAYSWSEQIDAKAKVLAGLVKNHIQEEEDKVFPVAEKVISEGERRALSDEYLQKCRVYLNLSTH